MIRTTLYGVQQARGARFGESDGWEVALDYGDWLAEYRAVRERFGIMDRSARGRLSLTGADRFSWLQGMVTNDVRLLESGAPAISACILNATGHLLADARIVNLPDSLLLDLPLSRKDQVHETLDRFIIVEDVEITDPTDSILCLSVQGPATDEIPIRKLTDSSVNIVPSDHTGLGGFDLYLPAETAGSVWNALVVSGVTPVGETAAEVLRIEAGIPRYSVDVDERNIPLECGLESTHISHQKGCYVGQEIIARIHSRGHTNRALTGFLVEGDFLPVRDGRIVSAEDDSSREIGWVTSAAHSPALGRGIAIGYLRHEARIRGASVQTESGIRLIVTDLPFVPRA